MNKIIAGLQYTRTYKEDLAVTPYLFLVKTKGDYNRYYKYTPQS